MPTAEAEVMAGADDERASYELAFHVLPTVVEGEVPSVFEAIKGIVTDAGGAITDQEAPQRFELAYEVEKHLEGKNRRFTSAYFGWVRFTAEPSAAHTIAQAIEHRSDILRYLLIRLTRAEEAHPFRFHDALSSQKQVATVEEGETIKAPADDTEEGGDVDEAQLDEALKKDEA